MDEGGVPGAEAMEPVMDLVETSHGDSVLGGGGGTKKTKRRMWLFGGGGLVVVLLFVVWVFVWPKERDDYDLNQQVSESQTIVRVSGTGRQKITLVAGETVVVFDSGEKVYLNNYASAIPYPTLLAKNQSAANYGRDYQIAPAASLAVQYEGIEYVIETEGCERDMHWFGDYQREVTTACNIVITSREATVRPVDARKTIVLGEDDLGRNYHRINEDPFVDIENVGVSLRKSSSYVRVPIMTYYGGDTIIFKEGELLNLKEKSVKIGPLLVTLKPERFTCESPYPICTEESGSYTEVIFEVTARTE